MYSLTHYAKGTPFQTDCQNMNSNSFSLPFIGFFSPFPHGTCILSVLCEYLDLEGGPPVFPKDKALGTFFNTYFGTPTGLSPFLAEDSTNSFQNLF